MAMPEQIDSAAHAGRRPTMLGSESFHDAGGESLLVRHGRGEEAAEARRASRFLARLGEPQEAFAQLGLDPPAREGSVIALLGCDVLEGVYAAMAGGADAGREHVAGLAPIEVEAARAVLAERRADR